jgi:hypothetical protein
VVRIENAFWGLAEGPWAGGGGMHFRQQWLSALRSAGSVREVAHALLQLEAALRPLAFAPGWRGEEAAAAAPAAAAAAGGTEAGRSQSQPPSRSVSRAPSAADLEAMAAAAQPSGGEESGSIAVAGGAGEAEGGGATAAARAADPYDLRYERPVMKGWEMDRRHHVARQLGVNRLPHALARKVGV